MRGDREREERRHFGARSNVPDDETTERVRESLEEVKEISQRLLSRLCSGPKDCITTQDINV